MKLIRDTEKATGLPISAEVYKRPKPAPEKALEPYFAWKGQIGCTKDLEFSEKTFAECFSGNKVAAVEALVVFNTHKASFFPGDLLNLHGLFVFGAGTV